jgi:hypothetical protein
MPSQTDCCNDALSQIGAQHISAIDDGTTNANLCQLFYPTLRDALLRSHHWNFALKWVQLTPDVTAPVAEFAYAYTLPADLLKVVDYGGNLPASTGVVVSYIYNSYTRPIVRYRIEGRTLVSNDSTAFIHYIRRVENPDEWDGLFFQVVATHLASKLANAIPKDPRRAGELLTIATTVLLPQALAVDGQEGSIEPFTSDDLLWGR